MRKTSTYARKRHARLAQAKRMHLLRPFTKTDIDEILLPPQLAFEFLRQGTGSPADYAALAHAINATLALSEAEGDTTATEACCQARDALIRVHERHQRTGGRLAFDGPGMQDVAVALDIFAQALTGNNPQAIFASLHAIQARLDAGECYDCRVEAV